MSRDPYALPWALARATQTVKIGQRAILAPGYGPGIPGYRGGGGSKSGNYDVIDDLLAFETLQSKHMPTFDALLKTALWT